VRQSLVPYIDSARAIVIDTATVVSVFLVTLFLMLFCGSSMCE
jgi:hypothetical protein